MDFQKVEPAVKKYLNKLKRKLPLERVILFGSFAEGKAREGSDIDLIILSSKFAEMTEDERLKLLYRQSVGFPYDLHVYGLTPKEFQSASPLTTLGEIKNKGVDIFKI